MILGIVAGEPSGDRLGAGLMAAMKRRQPQVRFIGIGGPLMLAEGLEALFPMDRLTMNGFIEPVKRLPDLIRILRTLLKTYRGLQLDAFIGVDFNVFNLLLERILKRRGVATAHYVSPSVYAWRRGRVNRIARATDLLLTLFPFEPAFYAASTVQAVFVGHPLADEIPPEMAADGPRRDARAVLGLPLEGTVVAVLPGSRSSEITLLGKRFFDACLGVQEKLGQVSFVVPCLSEEIQEQVQGLLKNYTQLAAVTYRGNGRQALIACDVALVKSGTSTLEGMLLHRPMVASYRLGPLTYQLVKRLLRTPYIALPNILAGRELVPELHQDDATPTALAENLLDQLDNRAGNAEYLAQFESLHRTLRRGADERAAEAVIDWLERRESG